MKIKIYSTDACPYCHMAKDYFKGKGIEFEDINVGKDQAAAHEMIEKSGQMGVPVIEIDNEIIIGFDVPKIEEILSRKSKSGDVGEKSETVTETTKQASEDEVKKAYDVVIIGGSAAGLTAALFARRRQMKALVVTKDIGGQISETLHIENYPGIEKTSGTELAKILKSQAVKFGAEIRMEEIVEAKVKKMADGKEIFVVRTKDGDEFSGRSLILAMGKTPRSLKVMGEEDYLGKGVSYCANCDAPLFKDKTVAVIGGGNAAFDAALLLTKIASKVYLVHRRKEFRAFESVINQLKTQSNIEFLLDSVVKEIKGDKFVNTMIVENKIDGSVKELAVSGVFIEIGSTVETNFVRDIVERDALGQIKTNKNTETSRAGMFAAGDVTDSAFKQIAAAVGEGCKAALAAYNYLHDIENKYVTDWSSHKPE